jgi:hypothetical protein
MLDLLKENLSCQDQRPQHYQTHRSLLRRASVHEVGVTFLLLTFRSCQQVYARHKMDCEFKHSCILRFDAFHSMHIEHQYIQF